MNFKEKIKNITENYGFNLNNSQIELFERYYDDLIEIINRRYIVKK